MARRTLCVTLMSVLTLLTPAAAVTQNSEKHVFVTVLDNNGVPVEGLTTAHFAVRENGLDRAVVRVEPLQTPMHVAVLVDTSVRAGVQDEAFRTAVVDFVERLSAFNQVAVYAFGDRPVQVAGFAQDQARLREAMTTMFGKGHERSPLIDAVDLALKDLARTETKRPVIIAITSESPETSSASTGSVIKRLIGQSVAFHGVSIATSTGSSSAAPLPNNIPASSQRLGAVMAAGEGDRERNRLLQQGTEATGGGRQRLTSTLALGQGLTRVARELSNSYLVAFTRPGTDKLRELQVGVMIEGVTLRATAAPFGTR